MRIDTKRNSDGTIELTFSIRDCPTIKVFVDSSLEVIKITPNNFINPELSPLDVQYYYQVFRTILNKINRMKEIQKKGES